MMVLPAVLPPPPTLFLVVCHSQETLRVKRDARGPFLFLMHSLDLYNWYYLSLGTQGHKWQQALPWTIFEKTVFSLLACEITVDPDLASALGVPVYCLHSNSRKLRLTILVYQRAGHWDQAIKKEAAPTKTAASCGKSAELKPVLRSGA